MKLKLETSCQSYMNNISCFTLFVSYFALSEIHLYRFDVIVDINWCILVQVLQFKDVPNSHIVHNVLIDYGSIDTIAMSKSEDLAMSIVRSHLGNELKCIFLPDGRRVYRKGGMEVCCISEDLPSLCSMLLFCIRAML